MCTSCWHAIGAPTVDNEKVRAAAALAERIYETPEGGTGGNLHIVLDDFNIEAEHIHWCLDQPEVTDLERECGELLLTMTMEERASALSLFYGYWKVEK